MVLATVDDIGIIIFLYTGGLFLVLLLFVIVFIKTCKRVLNCECFFIRIGLKHKVRTKSLSLQKAFTFSPFSVFVFHIQSFFFWTLTVPLFRNFNIIFFLITLLVYY